MSDIKHDYIYYLEGQVKNRDAKIESLKQENEKLKILLNTALSITEERSFWIKDEFIVESDAVEEWRKEAQAILNKEKA